MALGKDLSSLSVKPNQRSTDLFSKLLMEAAEAIITFDETNNVNFWNKAAERLFGYSSTEALGKDVSNFLKSEEGLIGFRVKENGDVGGKTDHGYEAEVQRKDGALVPVFISMTKAEDGGKTMHMVTVRDIAEEKKKADQMAQVQREIEARSASVDIACIVSETDTKGIITYVNDKHCEVSQYTREELIGSPQNIVRHPDMPKELFKEMWSTIGRGNIFRGIIKNRKKDGSPYYVDGIFTPVLGKNGKPIKYIGVRFDITDSVIESQRMKGIIDAIDLNFAFIEFDTKELLL